MRSIVCPVYSGAKEYSEKIAVSYGDQELSYAEFDRLIFRFSRSLTKSGIAENDLVAIVMKNSPIMMALIFALFRIGAVAIPLNFRFPPEKIVDLTAMIMCKTIIYSNEIKSRGEIYGAVSIDDLLNVEEIEYEDNEPVFQLEKISTVIMTSGSTGKSKAVVHTMGNHIYSALGANENIRFGAEDRWLLSLPLFHVGGLAVLFRVFLSGGCVVVPKALSELHREVISKNVTHLSLVYTQLKILIENLLRNKLFNTKYIKAVLCGGGPFSEKIILSALNSGLPVYRTYGLTEMSSQVTTTRAPVTEDNLNSSGSLLKYRELKIENGQILVRGKTRFRGYLEKGHLISVPENEWFCSGDSGYFRHGELFVTGRLDNMFISGGENIFPGEIESLLAGVEGVKTAFVLPVRDEKYGSRPVALLDIAEGKSFSKEELTGILSLSLPGFKIPDRFFRFTVKFEHMLKPDRKKIMELFTARDGFEEIL